MDSFPAATRGGGGAGGIPSLPNIGVDQIADEAYTVDDTKVPTLPATATDADKTALAAELKTELKPVFNLVLQKGGFLFGQFRDYLTAAAATNGGVTLTEYGEIDRSVYIAEGIAAITQGKPYKKDLSGTSNTVSLGDPAVQAELNEYGTLAENGMSELTGSGIYSVSGSINIPNLTDTSKMSMSDSGSGNGKFTYDSTKDTSGAADSLGTGNWVKAIAAFESADSSSGSGTGPATNFREGGEEPTAGSSSGKSADSYGATITGAFKLPAREGKFNLTVGYGYIFVTTADYAKKNYKGSYDKGPTIEGKFTIYDNAGTAIVEYTYTEAELKEMLGLNQKDRLPVEYDETGTGGSGGGGSGVLSKLAEDATYEQAMAKVDQLETFLKSVGASEDELSGFAALKISKEAYDGGGSTEVINKVNATIDGINSEISSN